MSKLASRCGAILIASGLSGLLAGCPQTPPPNTNVRPIPSTAPTGIVPTPPGDSVITSPTPFPGGPSGFPSTSPSSSGSSTDGSNGLVISSTNLPTAVLNFNYLYALQVAGGSGSYRWGVTSGNLPNGLTLDQNTGQIFGKPTQTGTFSFEIQVVDNQKATVARRQLFILVSDSNNGLNSLSILTSDLPSGVVDRRYSRTLEVTGGVAPFNWNVTAGSLPDGLKLNSTTGEISGTPTLSGEETFTVRVTDTRGDTQTRTLSITINRTDTDISILTSSLPPVAVGSSAYTRSVCGFDFSGQVKATGGDGNYTWSISKGEGDLNDAGLEMTDSGEIQFNGSGLVPGSYTFTVRVRDGEGNSASKVFTIDIRDLLVYSFSPGAGGEDLDVAIFGEGLDNGSAANVLFGGVSSSIDNVNTGSCDRLETSIPAGARTGLISIVDGSGNILGGSEMPFVAEDIVINEVFLSPDSSGNQFVELKNRSSASVSIAGWWLKYTDVDGNIQSFVIPPETPPLAPNALTTINIGASGGTTATNIYTGTSVPEMRFDPTSEVTQVALCAGDCNTVNDVGNDNYTTTYRDYLQFGPSGASADDSALHDGAENAGIWGAINDTLDAEDMLDPLDDVNITSTEGDPYSAHFGVQETGNAESGLLVVNGSKFSSYTGDAVLYFTPTGGQEAGHEQRIRRTVTGMGGTNSNRVRISAPIFKAQISASNTGDGSTNNGILVDDYSLFSPGDYVNVIAGGTIRVISQLASGPKVELTQVISTDSTSANVSDGTTGAGLALSNGALLGTESDVEGGNISIAYDRSPLTSPTTADFTVVRQAVDLNIANNTLLLDQPLASITVDASNTGDGLTGHEIQLTGVGNFQDGDLSLFNGQLCADDNPCNMTFGGTQVRLDYPLATMTVTDTNTGSGASGSSLEVDSVTGFSVGDRLLINGAERTINAITPAFGSSSPKVELDSPLVLTPSSNTGDGTTGHGISVSSTEGFVVNNAVQQRGASQDIAAIVGSKVELDAPLFSVAVDSNNSGDGTAAAPLQINDPSSFLQVGDTVRIPSINSTRTVSALTSTTITFSTAAVSATQSTLSVAAAISDTSVTVVNGSLFTSGDWVKFSNGDIRQLAGVATNVLSFSTGLSSALNVGATVNTLLGSSDVVNYVPTSDLLPVGHSTASMEYGLNLVPISGTFTLVPIDNPVARISRIPNSGYLYLAPQTGVLRKYLSIKFNNNGDQDVTDYTTTSAPSKGQ